jgi:hypothetical protein
MGMAVDANVLIFERIREELRAGRTPRSSIDEGFRRGIRLGDRHPHDDADRARSSSSSSAPARCAASRSP